jgi:molecular chaperone GrpE
MTEKELWAIFERQGIRAINPLGEKFDPHFHQAMLEIENQEQTPGTIVQVLQIGYTLHDRLLRPALVAVVKHSP